MSIPREHRLRKHAEFEVVYQCGQRHFSQALTAVYLLRPQFEATGPEGPEAVGGQPRSRKSRIGITVGRAMGKAIVRNRIKRRVRAAVAQHIGRLTRPLDIVINPKKSALDIEFQQLCIEVARAFDVAEQKANSAQSRRPEKARPYERQKALRK